MKSENCLNALNSWKYSNMFHSYAGTAVPLAVLGIMYFISKVEDFTLPSWAIYICVGVAILLFCITEIFTKKVVNTEYLKMYHNCKTETLTISPAELHGCTGEGKLFRFLTSDVKSVRVERIPNSLNSPSRFINDILVINTIHGDYKFYSFSNCADLKSEILLLKR